MSTVFSCPACGAGLRVDAMGAGSGSGGGWERGREYAFGAGKLPAGAAEYSRQTPTGRTDNIEGGLRLPLGQAAITGAVAVALACVVALLRGGWAWWEPVVIGVAVFGLAWFYLLIDSRQLLRTSETVTAEPSAAAFSVEITIPKDGGKKVVFAQFEARPEHVRRFAQAALDGRLTVYGGHGLSRGIYQRLRDESLRRGLLAWQNSDHHASGVELTRAGGHVFRLLSDPKTA